MKKILFAVGIGVLFSSVLVSCEKPKEPIDVTKNAFLLKRAWKLKDKKFTANVDVETPVWVDEYTPLEPCKKDDYLYFHTTSSGAVFDYFVKCATTSPDSIAFWYAITDNDNTINIYTNPDDMAGSNIMWGKIETPNINEFKVIQKSFNTTTELNEQREYTYEAFTPTGI